MAIKACRSACMSTVIRILLVIAGRHLGMKQKEGNPASNVHVLVLTCEHRPAAVHCAGGEQVQPQQPVKVTELSLRLGEVVQSEVTRWLRGAAGLEQLQWDCAPRDGGLRMGEALGYTSFTGCEAETPHDRVCKGEQAGRCTDGYELVEIAVIAGRELVPWRCICCCYSAEQMHPGLCSCIDHCQRTICMHVCHLYGCQ